MSFEEEKETESFLALKVRLTDGIRKKLESVDSDFIVYDGSEAKHKIPHVTIVGPRKTFDIDAWKEKIEGKVKEAPTKFAITSFNSFWSSSKLGFKGGLNGKVDVETPHLVLFDCGKDKEGTKSVWGKYEPIFSKFEGTELEIESIAVIERNKGVIYSEAVGVNEKLQKYTDPEEFLKDCLYLPVAPEDAVKLPLNCSSSECRTPNLLWRKYEETPEVPGECPKCGSEIVSETKLGKVEDDSKSPNRSENWPGPTIRSWSPNGEGCYTHEMVEESDWSRWGIVDWNGPERLLIIDIDLYEMGEDRKKEVFDAIKELGTRIHRSQSGGAHVFLLVDPEDLTEDGKLPVSIGKHIDDKLNGYVLSPDCEGYEVELDVDPKLMDPKDLPDALLKEEPKGRPISADVPELEVEENKETTNVDGKSLRRLRKNDKKLNDLLSELKPEGYDYPSRSEADQALIIKLIQYGFNIPQIYKIVKKYRPYEKTERKDYLETTLESAATFLKRRGKIAVLTGELKKKLEEKTTKFPKYSWKQQTKFVTFAKHAVSKSLNRVVEKESTLELPATIADELEDKDIAAEKVWKCQKCGALRMEWPEEPECPECGKSKKVGEDKKAPYFPIRPHSWRRIGETLLENYRFAVPRETMTESKPGRVHIYDGGVYKFDEAKGFIREKVKQIDPESEQAKQKNVVDHIATKTLIPESEFGAGEEKTVVENGILDLSEMELKEHDPDEHALAKMPVPYNPNAGEPALFLENLKVWFPKKEDRLRIQEIAGTILVNEKLHKKGGILVGPTDAGKSTLLEILRGVIGTENLSAQAPKSLADTRWGKAKLRNALLNATDEVSAGKIYNLNVLKRILDGNPIDAERKNERVFEFSPTCEHLYAANQTPTADRRDDAFWNRWIVMEIPEPIPEDDRDPDLAEKILEKEKEAILNWMIEGYKRFKGNGNKFSNPQDWTEARNKWLNWGDSVQRFIEKCVIKSEDRDFKVTSRDVYEIYSAFTEAQENLDLRDQKVLTAEIKKLGYSSYSDSYRIGGKKQRGFKGIDIELPQDVSFKKDDHADHAYPLLLTKKKRLSDVKSKKRGEGEKRGHRGQEKIGEVEDLGTVEEEEEDKEVEIPCDGCKEMGIEREAKRKVSRGGRDMWLCSKCLQEMGYE